LKSHSVAVEFVLSVVLAPSGSCVIVELKDDVVNDVVPVDVITDAVVVVVVVVVTILVVIMVVDR